MLSNFLSQCPERLKKASRALTMFSLYTLMRKAQFPLQEIIFQNRKETEPYLAFYTHDLTDYEYTLTEDSRVDLRLVNPGAVRLGVVERLERTGKDTFVVEMTARYFDFFNHQWTYTRINVTYEKVERSSE